jgi:hypothetical protein
VEQFVRGIREVTAEDQWLNYKQEETFHVLLSCLHSIGLRSSSATAQINPFQILGAAFVNTLFPYESKLPLPGYLQVYMCKMCLVRDMIQYYYQIWPERVTQVQGSPIQQSSVSSIRIDQ